MRNPLLPYDKKEGVSKDIVFAPCPLKGVI
jgi:hypothetical protein